MAQYGIIMPQAPAHFTHPRLQIRTAQDAHRVFEAVRQGILPLIRRRLSPSERDLLASGQVFVWEEAPTGSAAGDETSQTTSGLERWTDGRRWSQSRMREPFLFYEEKVQTTAEEKQAKADRRARKASSSDSQAASAATAALLPLRRQDRPSKPDGLTKQTYSSYVTPTSASFTTTTSNPPQQQPAQQRKWHCVAYFSAADWNNLPSVDAYVELKNLVVPEGVYTSTKGTGKTGGPPPLPFHSDELAAVNMGNGGNGGGIVNGAGGGGIGPIRRPMSRGDLSSAPYATSSATVPRRSAGDGGGGSSLGPTSPCSSSSMSDDPRSPACDSPVSYYSYPGPPQTYRARNGHAHAHAHQHSAPPPIPHQHQQQQHQNSLHPNSHSFPHHHHSSSTSSASTGSPPTPGFMAPIPSPSSFTPGGPPARGYSNPPQLPSHPSLMPGGRRASSSLSKSSSGSGGGGDDVVMLDAPTLRTPTKDHPQYHHSKSSPVMVDGEYFAGGSGGGVGAPMATTTTTLPSFNSILGQARASGPAGRSREDSLAIGAFRVTL